MESLFDHEKLEVYRVAREFNRFTAGLMDRVPRGHHESRDNLKRAGKSITRNIAEGSGKWSPPDKAHFYQIARGSATEAAASLDELVDIAGLPEVRVREGKVLLSRITAMLTAMIRSVQHRDQAEGKPAAPERPATVSSSTEPAA
jgi:four helix bundle protein